MVAVSARLFGWKSCLTERIFHPVKLMGNLGQNAKKALRAYAEAQQLPSSDDLTEDAWRRFQTDDHPETRLYECARKASREILHGRAVTGDGLWLHEPGLM
jgi:hypothetical protein